MKAILLHGTDGSNESNWLPWLKQQLEKHKITVYAPSLPNAAYPNGRVWSDFVIQNIPFEPDEEQLLLGTLLERLLFRCCCKSYQLKQKSGKQFS